MKSLGVLVILFIRVAVMGELLIKGDDDPVIRTASMIDSVSVPTSLPDDGLDGTTIIDTIDDHDHEEHEEEHGISPSDFEDEQKMMEEVCPLKKNGMFELRADLWWTCQKGTGLLACFSGALDLLQDNLNRSECHKDPCYAQSIPDQVYAIRLFIDQVNRMARTEKKTTTTSSTCGRARFDHYLNLLANVLLQKSIHCHLDTAVLMHLGEETERLWNLQEHCRIDGTRLEEDEERGRDVDAMRGFLANGGHFYFEGFAPKGHAKVYFYPKDGGIDEGSSTPSYDHERYQEHRDGIMGKLDDLKDFITT